MAMTHYELLSINGGSSTEKINAAYQKKIQESSSEDRTAIYQAYQILKDPTSREMYDNYLVQLDEMREEAQYCHFVQKAEEYQLNDGTWLSKWQKLYRLDLKDFHSLSNSDRITKIFAELFFRSCTGMVGVIIVLLFLIYSGHIVNFFTFIMSSPDSYIILYILLGTFLGFFISSKFYGNIYRNWKISSRNE
jgi:curved DNA-binding protein CbpA